MVFIGLDDRPKRRPPHLQGDNGIRKPGGVRGECRFGERLYDGNRDEKGNR